MDVACRGGDLGGPVLGNLWSRSRYRKPDPRTQLVLLAGLIKWTPSSSCSDERPISDVTGFEPFTTTQGEKPPGIELTSPSRKFLARGTK